MLRVKWKAKKSPLGGELHTFSRPLKHKIVIFPRVLCLKVSHFKQMPRASDFCRENAEESDKTDQGDNFYDVHLDCFVMGY